MRYVKAEYELYQIDLAYRFYISESIRLYGENKHLKESFSNLYESMSATHKKADFDKEQYVNDTLSMLGIEVI